MSNTAETLGEKADDAHAPMLTSGAVAAGARLVLAVGVVSLAAVEQ